MGSLSARKLYRTARHEQGSALILTLWALVILGVVGLAFVDGVNIELAISKYASRTLQARELARAGIVRAKAVLRQDTDGRDRLDDSWNNDTGFDSFELGGGWVSLLGEPDPDTAEQTFGMVDEARKLNINTATPEMLLRLPDMTEELVDALIDWRDADDNPRPLGAESAYYESLEPAYHAKNEPFETLEELLLVKDFSKEILYGEDWNLNGRLDAAEDDGGESDPPDNADGNLDRGLAAFLTVYSEDLNVSGSGSKRINLSTLEEDPGALGEILSDQQLQDLLAFVQARQLNSIAQLLGIPSFVTDDYKAFKAVADLVTTDDRERIPGLVNVLTAPLEVLAALPGLDEDKAQAIIAYRDSVETDYTSIAWLLDVEGMDREDFEQLAPFVTVRSYQFLVDSCGITKGKVFRRVRAILDRSSPEVKLLYRRDVTPLGPPFAVREEGESS